jgi:sugar lactone lactonase YvrE
MCRRLVLPLVIFVMGAQVAVGEDVTLAKADYPEGPLWYRLRLYYGEMMRDRVVMSSDLRTTVTFWKMLGCGPVSIAPYRGNELLVLCHLMHKVVRVSLSGVTLAIIGHDDAGRPFVHPNASSADDKGGVYFTASGGFSLSAPATGAVLYLDRNGKMRRLVEGIRYANGIALDSPHHRVLVSEHLNRRVLAFPLLADGSLGKPSVFFDLDKQVLPHVHLDPLAGPDGLELDHSGRLFVAEYGAGRIHLVGPNGAWLGTLGGLKKYVTDMALLPGGRVAITEAEVNDVPPFPGDVLIVDRFLSRFKRH